MGCGGTVVQNSVSSILVPQTAERSSGENSSVAPEGTPSTGHQESDTHLLVRGAYLKNYSIIEGWYSTELHGEVENQSRRRKTLVVKATFFSDAGKIVGVANGVVNELDPGETITFTLTSTDPLVDYGFYRVQVETEL
jgi:hypothetical protein